MLKKSKAIIYNGKTIPLITEEQGKNMALQYKLKEAGLSTDYPSVMPKNFRYILVYITSHLVKESSKYVSFKIQTFS